MGVYTVFSLPDFQYLKDIVPKPHGRFTFGAAIILEWMFNKWPVNATYVYLMIFAAFTIAFFLSSRTGLVEDRGDSIKSIFFIVGSLNLFFCFFTNTNYDYRCIFFILILPWLFERLKCAITPVSTKRYIKLLLLLLPIVVWNETIITLIGLKVGAPGISKAKLLAMLNFYILEHLSTWIVITILLAFCIELFKVPIRIKIMAPFRRKPD